MFSEAIPDRSTAKLDGSNTGITMFGSGVPAESRWGSMSESNSELSLCEMCHGSFRRLFTKTFKNKDCSHRTGFLEL
jgi:hypothetical protein